VTPHVGLVPAALAVWGVALCGLLLNWQAAVAAGVLAGLAGVLALRRRWWQRSGAVALVVLAPVAAGWVGVQVHLAATHPLRAAAQHGAQAVVLVELSTRPRPLESAGFGSRPGGADRVLLTARVLAARTGGTFAERRGEVVLLAPADRWRDLLPEQRVVARGVLLPPRSGELTAAVLRVRGPPQRVEPAPVWQRAAESLRAGLREASGVLGPDAAGLLPALVVGDTGGVPPRLVEEFRTAGLSHLLAVSGANLAIFCGAVLLLLRAFGTGPRGCAAGSLAALAGFVLLAGPEPSVLRAAAMGAVALLALVLGRERSALPALATAVIVLVLYDPALGTDLGFALSVVATAALVLVAPRLAGWLRDRGVPVGLAEALAVAVAAHLATAPLVAGMSGRISLVAVAANLVAAPVVAPATVLGVLAALVAAVHDGTADVLVRLAGPEVDWLVLVGREAARVPSAAVAWPGGWGGGLLLAAVLVAGWALLRARRVRVLVVAAVAGFLLVLVPVGVVAPGWPVRGWAVVACDVGQGDALALAVGEPGGAVLVDTGPDPGPVAGCLRRLGVERVPLLVLSHLHADHVGGLAAVLAEQSVGAVAVGPLREPAWAWEEVRRQTDRAGVALVELEAGQRLSWPGLELEVLGPRVVGPVRVDDENTAVNDRSLVLRALTPAGRVLLTGDVELAGQAALLGDEAALAADVLKVPHHGSRYSLPRFLAAVRPRIALVSVGGDNRYGHPNPLVVDGLSRGGALVTRTDEAGDVAVLPGPDGPLVVRRGHRDLEG
jgi:competence protein ComEC